MKQKQEQQQQQRAWKLPWGSHTARGIEIGEDRIRMCEIEQRQGQVRVLNYVTVELPAGAMDDGRIKDRAALAAALKQAVGAARWRGCSVHLALPSQTVMIRMIRMPDVPDKEMRKLIQFELNHRLHLPFEQPGFDFVIQPVRAAGQDEMAVAQDDWLSTDDAAAQADNSLREVMLLAAPLELLDTYAGLLEEAGLQPRSMEIKAFSLLRLVQRAGLERSGVWLMVDVKRDNSDLSIIDEGVIKVTRNVEIRFDAPGEETSSDPDDPFAALLSPQMSFANAAQELIAELERLINFYRYSLHHREEQFHAVIVSGDIARLDELTEQLSRGMTLPVSLLAWEEPTVAEDGGWDSSRYAVPLGLALRGKQR